MVATKKALMIAGGSALAAGALHFAAHTLAPAEHAVLIAGSTVVLSVFLISFIGMKV